MISICLDEFPHSEPSTLPLALILISGGKGSETLRTCPSVPQSHGLVKVEQRDLCHGEG